MNANLVAAQATTPRRVVVILGMHRSGTSLLAQLVARLGVALGQSVLTQSAPDNKHGYWEHREIAEIQDLLLAALGRIWHEPRGVLPLPQGWLASEPAAAAIARLTTIVEAELAANPGSLWGFKDPRTLRFLPMWHKVFAACGVAPIFILALRRPESVVASLVKRNGLNPAHARFLWVQHNLEPFRGERVSLAATIDYDQWFAKPARGLQAILRAIRSPLPWPVALDLCDLILDRGERHHQSAGQADATLADRIYRLLLDSLPETFRAYRLHQLARQLDESESMLCAWQEMIEQCQPPGAPPTAHWARMAAQTKAATVDVAAGDDSANAI